MISKRNSKSRKVSAGRYSRSMEFKIVVQMLIPTYTKLHIARFLRWAMFQQLTKFFLKKGGSTPSGSKCFFIKCTSQIFKLNIA